MKAHKSCGATPGSTQVPQGESEHSPRTPGVPQISQTPLPSVSSKPPIGSSQGS